MITDLILEGAQILDDGEGFGIDRSKYLNASTANSCIRKQWYERNLPEVEQDWGFARRGKQGELYLVDCLRAAGAMVDYVGDEQVSIVSEEHRISATPDGYIEEGDGWHALEFKTIDPRTNKARLPKADHVTQLQIGMELAHLQGADFPKPVCGHLIYMDASNYNEIVEIQIERDPGILKRLKARAKAMLDAKKVDKLDREGKRTGECKLYGGCRSPSNAVSTARPRPQPAPTCWPRRCSSTRRRRPTRPQPSGSRMTPQKRSGRSSHRWACGRQLPETTWCP